MRTSIYISFLLIFLPLIFQAQDPHFSQFYANRVYLNPAYAGFEQGFTTTVNYRNQWFRIPDNQGQLTDGFETMNITAEYQIPCFPASSENFRLGTAVSYFEDQTGDAPFTTQGGTFALSAELATLRGQTHNRFDLRVGAQIGYFQRRLTGDYFIYSDQLHPIFGLTSEPLEFSMESEWYPSYNVGAMMRGRLNKNKFRNFLWTLGGTYSNVNHPIANVRATDQTFRVPGRLTVHGGFTALTNGKARESKQIYIAPQFRYEIQDISLHGPKKAERNLKLLTVGAYLITSQYYFGAFYQNNLGAEKVDIAANTDQLNLMVGFDFHSVTAWSDYWSTRINKNDLIIVLSYDVNLNGLPYGSSSGTFELSMRFNISNWKKKNCSFGRFELYDGKCPIKF